MTKRYKIQFPPSDLTHLDQDQAFFYLYDDKGERKKLLFHAYDQLYNYKGLYEQLFYDRLKCNSPHVVTEALRHTIDTNKEHFSELRVLDFGAGNGMMGETMKKYGTARMVGVDIIQEARDAVERDRPGVYDEFFVKDFLKLNDDDREEIRGWNLNCLTTVAALGFGDIPPRAFLEALDLINSQGWIAFNIKETFLYNTDNSGFSKTIRELIFSEYLDIHHLERYRHRFSIDGSPL